METFLRRTHAELSLRSLSVREAIALGAITVIGLLLRTGVQIGRLFTGDEVGTVVDLEKSTAYLLTHFGGELTMNYFTLAEKAVAWLCGTIDWRLTLLPLVAAVAIIPLTASLALKFSGSSRTALIAASLAAFNPYLVWWSPVIRAYSPLAALSLLAINEFLRWYQTRDFWSGGRCAAAVLLLLLAHPNGIYTVAFLILVFAIETASFGWSGARKFLWDSKTLWVPLVVAGILVALAYWRLLPDIAKYSKEWTDTPPTSMEYLNWVFGEYFGRGYKAFFFATFLLLGLWSATQRQKPLLLLWGAVALGPVLMSLRGISHYPWAYARFLIFSLPSLLILLAEGISWFATRISVGRPIAAPVKSWSLAALVVVFWMPALPVPSGTRDYYRSYMQMTQFLRAHFQKGNIVVSQGQYRYHFWPTMSSILGTSEDVIGPSDYFQRLPQQLDAPVEGRVFYIVPQVGDSMVRKTQVQRFGPFEIAIYSGKTARSLLQRWREDLLYRTADRIDQNFQGDYQLLALIDERLPSDQSPDHWRLLAERCFDQTLTRRYMPPQLLRERSAQAH
ncbi:MAG TPA: hypothetical protein VJ420_05905 [Candidatus Udaeobacter sp.]|nr:hypothetical protein [Candidatus Udaeobacter sp.]